MAGKPPPPVGQVLRLSAMTMIYIAGTEAGEPIVVKRLLDDVGDDASAVRRFAREKHLLGVLRHPGLPVLVASGENWFATARIDDAVLRPGERERIIASGEMPALLSRLIDVLAYIHARGVVHMDIKPGHILLRDGHPVLIDFGIAALSFDDPLTRAELAGSPAWMAPEQVAGGPSAPAMDIWSFGLTAIWLMTGVRPYTGTSEEILRGRRKGRPPVLDWPAAEQAGGGELRRILGACLETPERRPDAATLAKRLPALIVPEA